MCSISDAFPDLTFSENTQPAPQYNNVLPQQENFGAMSDNSPYNATPCFLKKEDNIPMVIDTVMPNDFSNSNDVSQQLKQDKFINNTFTPEIITDPKLLTQSDNNLVSGKTNGDYTEVMQIVKNLETKVTSLEKKCNRNAHDLLLFIVIIIFTILIIDTLLK